MNFGNIEKVNVGKRVDYAALAAVIFFNPVCNILGVGNIMVNPGAGCPVPAFKPGENGRKQKNKGLGQIMAFDIFVPEKTGSTVDVADVDCFWFEL